MNLLMFLHINMVLQGKLHHPYFGECMQKIHDLSIEELQRGDEGE